MVGVKKFTVAEKYVKVWYVLNDEEIIIKWNLKDGELPNRLEDNLGAFIGILEDEGRKLFREAGA